MAKLAIAAVLLVLLVGSAVAQDASRTSDYKGGPGTGKKFAAAKRGLLDEYAKAKGTKWVASNEKLTDTTYTVTYTFPSAAILKEFQTWQYAQPAFKSDLEKYSLKSKGTGASSPAGRKLL